MSLDRRSERRIRPLALAGRAPRRAILVPLFLWLLVGAQARAQTGITATFASEYSLRGLSLSAGRAVPQLRIDHDTNDGWYGGAFGSRVALRASPASAVLIGYGGYARRLATGLGWDAGFSHAVFARDARYNYTEFYAGISSDRLGARLSLAPDYYGTGRTAYAEINGAYPLGERVRLTAHAGLLRRFSSAGGAGRTARDRVDLRVAVGADIGDGSVELGLQARQRDPGTRVPRARALFASASLGF